jgi:hypothetical protein
VGPEGKPTEAEVDAAYKEMLPEEYGECGGVSHKTDKVVIR